MSLEDMEAAVADLDLETDDHYSWSIKCVVNGKLFSHYQVWNLLFAWKIAIGEKSWPNCTTFDTVLKELRQQNRFLIRWCNQDNYVLLEKNV